MIGYNLKLAHISLKQNPILVAMIVIIMAAGIGVTMTLITINASMGANPIPDKSEQLFKVRLDSYGPEKTFYDSGDPPPKLAYNDAIALLESDIPTQSVMMTATQKVISNTDTDLNLSQQTIRTTSYAMFSMFNIPFLHGGPWGLEEDQSRARVIVISKTMALRYFNREDVVGQTLLLDEELFKIVGVTDHWNPQPRYYDLQRESFIASEEFFIPFSAMTDLEWRSSSGHYCWKGAVDSPYQTLLNSECVWILVWVQLDDLASKNKYKDFMDSYAQQQNALGRFARTNNNRLTSVTEWLDDQNVVSSDLKSMLLLSALFLLLCMVNTLGLLLAKFQGKSSEIGVRRAVGAQKRHILIQFFVESSYIGLLGGILGLAFTYIGLEATKQWFVQIDPSVMELNLGYALLTILVAVSSTLIAGIYPSLRACNISPAIQLKI